jgi:hypothetical protein
VERRGGKEPDCAAVCGRVLTFVQDAARWSNMKRYLYDSIHCDLKREMVIFGMIPGS